MIAGLLLSACFRKEMTGENRMDRSSGKKGREVRFSGVVSHTRSYCGGAAPPESLLEKLRTPEPYVQQKLVWKDSVTGTTYAFTTLADGSFNLRIPAGTYFLYHDRRPEKTASDYYDPNCPAWLQTVLATVRISGSTFTQNVVIHIPCEPCDPNSHIRP